MESHGMIVSGRIQAQKMDGWELPTLYYEGQIHELQGFMSEDAMSSKCLTFRVASLA